MKGKIALVAAACMLGPLSGRAQDTRPAPRLSQPHEMTVPNLPQAVPPLPTGLFRATCQTGAGYCPVTDSAPIPPGTICSCGADAGQTR